MLKLRLLTGPRAGRQLRVSDAKPVSIGRRVGRLRLHDSRVSKNHAEIYFANDMWVLRDLGSANGTYVNRKRATGLVELEPGDLVQMGRVLFKVVRCDGIGMDTQPGLTDELLEEDGLDDALGQGSAQVPPRKALPSDDEDDEQDDLDLDAMFGATQSDDANDDSDIFAAIDAPAVDKSPPVNVNELEEPASEMIQATFDVPDDDDDSFFSDLGEATDTTGGVGVAENQSSDDDDDLNLEGVDAVTDKAESSDLAEASDPFLSGDEEEDSNDSSDLISLEDESGMGPRNSGTTLLTAVPHDDLANDESKADSSAAIDPAHEPEVKESAAAATDSDFADEAADFDDAYGDEDEDDGQAPALVGLQLNQAPPQQPDVLDADEQESAALDTEQSATTGDDETEDEPVLPLGDAVDASTDESALADALLDEVTDGLSAEAADENKVEDEDAKAFDITDALSDQDFDPEIQEALAELDDSDDAYDLAAFDDQTPDEDEDASDEEVSDAIGSDVLDLTEVQAGLVDDEPEDVFGALSGSGEPASDEAVAETEPDDEPAAVDAGVPEDDELLEDAPVFDIDAAFDALSEGLDDSFELPAIGADEQQEQSAEHAEADSLAGSQLDVNFIKDALAKLEQTQGESAEGPGDTSPKAAALPTMLPGSSSDRYFQSPPPGLNPSSLKPPVEPGQGYRPPSSSSGRWFFTLLLLLAIGGVGAWYITEHYEIQITGREDAGPASANAAAPGLPGSTSERTDQNPTIEPAPPSIEPPTPVETIEPRPQGPDPFASGPVVLGQDALEGITRGNTAPLLPRIPVTNPGSTDRPDAPTTSGPEPVLPPTIEPGPVVVPDVADQPTEPAKPQPPVRIVFLVDASGSLVDSLPQMLVWLNRAVQTIESDERFAIYFFKSGEPIGIKPEGMIAPTREVLNRISADWLSADRLPLLPSGRSNPTRAIAKALALDPTDIYFLSDDAFAFTQGDSNAEQALDLVKDALGESDARIHGVQFFYRSDNSVLETLSNETKGTYEFVRESVVPNADPIDLLEELGGE